MAHRKWREIKQQPSMLPGTAVPGSCLVSFHILWAILSTSTVHRIRTKGEGVPKMQTTVLVLRMASRIWKETKQEPGTAVPGNMIGCCLISLHFL